MPGPGKRGHRGPPERRAGRVPHVFRNRGAEPDELSGAEKNRPRVRAAHARRAENGTREIVVMSSSYRVFSIQLKSAPSQPIHLEVSSLRSPIIISRGVFIRRRVRRALVPRASIRVQPLQHLEVPSLRRLNARFRAPWTAVRACPLQHLEVPARRRVSARAFDPRTADRTQPLQRLKVPVLRRRRARV